MSIIRPFRADDLFKFNNMCVPQSTKHWFLLSHNTPIPSNLDIWTETVRPSHNKSTASTLPSFPRIYASPFTVWPRFLFQLPLALA